ncbi:Uncharacterised protein [Mycobacteroides abscessus subsp. abscessus]|uniref:hypothetical protein n=1 Tax=Mycobacteroides abscessus TaxID=36809 RepID=UPI00092A83B7|nr:hypothetical protein [Mycobacteroides abscessus]SHX65944.1 Uncharacterised protein [Mycobacteroides abscessus subsp. abscessus]SIC60753.1 Uncharacterised protein [Mycobacteroides abscessus subsp. abscessus]SKK21416.1 Uncharacterised protein [Mycobacteroides abscessus subsp. abscessus]SKP50727.1 Uncharacterised protein [Mycobacteroides abscessus subsp. abscessus]
MTENLIDTETRWNEQQLPFVDAELTVSAWTSDEEIAAMAAALTHVYGNEFELDTILRLFRSQLRAAAMAANAESA